MPMCSQVLRKPLLILLSCLVCVATEAGEAKLTYLSGTQELTVDKKICDPAPALTFKVRYSCQGSPCSSSGFGANPYKFHVTLSRDGAVIGTQDVQLASAYFLASFDVPDLAGKYKARVEIQRRWAPWIWNPYDDQTTNTIVVSEEQAVPVLRINGQSLPTDGSPLDLCASHVWLDASKSKCEQKYFIHVMESDRWWDRTGEFEWMRWFDGMAPSGAVNLQQLTTAESYPPNFTGPGEREGSPMIGGDLTSGKTRHYRVRLCTAEPAWTCDEGLVRVDGGC